MRNQERPVYDWVLVVAVVLGLTLLPQQGVVAATSAALPDHDLYGFIDDFLAEQRIQYHLAGAAVVVVKDGQLALAQGYGYADLAQGRAVDPVRTVFPLASLAKLFTATAVMQLVEQGKLDLHADINTYLGDYQIPATYPTPITLAHLLSHTAGFEERLIGDFTCAAETPPTLAEFLRQHQPQRIRPPGEAPAYSNEGMDLAGYIVQQVSGVPFASYVQRQILEPLGMVHSAFAMPTATAGSNLAQAYNYHTGTYIPLLRDCFNHLPSGGLYGSASDMAHFMLAYLQDGQFNGQQILQPTTVQQMQQQLYRFDPRVSGNAYGFWESARNDQRILYHFGNVSATYSVIALLPERQVGLFAVYNSADGSAASRDLLQAFLDHYYPVQLHPLPTPPANFTAAPYVGSYTPLDRPFTTLDEIGYAVWGAVQVQAMDTGMLVTTVNDAGSKTWQIIGPQLFHQINGQELLVFRTDASGRATHLFFDSDPSVAYSRQPWYETPSFTYLLLGANLLLLLAALLRWPWAALPSRLSFGPPCQASLGRKARPGLARVLALGMSLAFTLHWAGLQFLVSRGELRYGATFPLSSVLALGYIGLALLTGVLCFALLAWKDRYWGLLDRLHYTLIALAGVGMFWLLAHWHLLALPPRPA